MYIKRKVFSKVVTTEGEEKLFSTSDISVNHENGEVRLFSKKISEKSQKTIKLCRTTK